MISEQFNSSDLSAEDIKSIISMIGSPQDIQDFLEKVGDKLGTGSSRVAIGVGPDKVFKVALNLAGIQQNLVEVDFNHKLEPFVPELYDYHPDGYWIEVEKGYNLPGDSAWLFANIWNTETDGQYGKELEDFVIRNWDSFDSFHDKLASLKKKKDDFGELISKLRIKRSELEDDIYRLRFSRDPSIDHAENIALQRSISADLDDIQTNLSKLFKELEPIEDEISRINNSFGSSPLAREMFEILRLLHGTGQKNPHIIKSLVNFVNKIKSFKISDLSPKNIGYSKKRKIPIVLDYGYEASSLNKFYDGTRAAWRLRDPDLIKNLSSPKGSDRAEKVASKIRVESFFIREQDSEPNPACGTK